MAAGEHSPQRAALPGGAPAGLVHVQALAGAHALSQLLVWLRQRPASALEDRLDRAGAQAHTEELFAELHDIAARDTVSHRQHRHGRFKTRTKRAASDIRGKLRPRPLTAAWAAHPRAAMLDHPGRDHRQPFDLMAHRLTHAEQLARRENTAALAALRPVLDDLIHRTQRQQLAAVTLMPRLGALRTSGAIFPRAARRLPGGSELGGSEEFRECFASSGAPASPPALRAAGYAIHRQQNLNYSLPPRVIDRFRLRALHTPDSTKQSYVPLPTERLLKPASLQALLVMEPTGIEPVTSCLQIGRRWSRVVVIGRQWPNLLG